MEVTVGVECVPAHSELYTSVQTRACDLLHCLRGDFFCACVCVCVCNA